MANYFKQLNEAFDKKYGLDKVYYPNGVECKDNSVDMDKALDYQYGTDRDKDNSKYTAEEKQRALNYWIGKTDSLNKEPIKEDADMHPSWFDCDLGDQIEAIQSFVKNYKGTKVFEDFAASFGVDVEDVIDLFADVEAAGIVDIPQEIQIDDKYRNDEIYESKRKKLIKEDLADNFVDAIYDRLLQDVQYKVYDEVMNVASKQVESLPTYRPMTSMEANKNYADALHSLAEAAFIKYCVSIRDDEVDEGIVNTLTQPIRDVADTVRDVLNIPDKNTKLDEDNGSLGNEIDRYQKWVDFDMSRYGKISERTQQMVNKAGYQILKDDHGDYEVAAGHFE